MVERARAAASRYDNGARRPVVIEFAGAPKAGKSSTIGHVAAFLKRCGFRVEVVVERASVCPIRDKKHANFNVWTACTTLAQLLERTQDPPKADDPQILILDRGIFDALCWLTMMERLSRIRKHDREKVESFLLVDDWRKRISGVVVMSCDPGDSMERERGVLPVEGATGSIMNQAVLEQVRVTTDEMIERHKRAFRVFPVDTSEKKFKSKPDLTCEAIADCVLNWVEEHLREDILHVPREQVRRHFQGVVTLREQRAEAVRSLFQAGKFLSRELVESDDSLVQALPVAVIRNKSGDVLRLKRRERSDENPLHEKLVVWAGGHVRSEDATNGDAVLHATRRELREELRLDVDESSLRFLGAIFVEKGDKLSKHVALVFEWRAETDDVAVSLSSAEFFERRGTSLSGSFIKSVDLAKEVAKGGINEPWSCEIVQSLLSDTAAISPKSLF